MLLKEIYFPNYFIKILYYTVLAVDFSTKIIGTYHEDK